MLELCQRLEHEVAKNGWVLVTILTINDKMSVFFVVLGVPRSMDSRETRWARNGARSAAALFLSMLLLLHRSPCRQMQRESCQICHGRCINSDLSLPFFVHHSGHDLHIAMCFIMLFGFSYRLCCAKLNETRLASLFGTMPRCLCSPISRAVGAKRTECCSFSCKNGVEQASSSALLHLEQRVG